MSTTITCDSVEELTAKSAEILRALGWTVIEPSEDPIKQAALCARFGVSARVMSYALRHPLCPKYVGITGPGGSITGVYMNAKLNAWLSARFGKETK